MLHHAGGPYRIPYRQADWQSEPCKPWNRTHSTSYGTGRQEPDKLGLDLEEKNRTHADRLRILSSLIYSNLTSSSGDASVLSAPYGLIWPLFRVFTRSWYKCISSCFPLVLASYIVCSSVQMNIFVRLAVIRKRTRCNPAIIWQP